MGEDYQWRQLGSIVNKVLMDTQTKAARTGMRSKVAARIRRDPLQTQAFPGSTAQKSGHGFLNPDYQAPAPAAQLELPFGIAAQSDFGKPRAPKGVRLI